MLYSDNGVTHNYNAKDNTKSNWSTAYFHCGLDNYLALAALLVLPDIPCTPNQGWGQVQYLYLVLVLKYMFIST